MRMIIPLFLAPLALACAEEAEQDSSMADADRMVNADGGNLIGQDGEAVPRAPGTAAEFVSQVGASDQYEIRSSRLALDRSTNQQVRAFAQRMVEDHGRTSGELAEAARTAGLTVNEPRISDQQERMLAELENQAEDGFDQLYLEQQRQAHRMTHELLRAYADSGDDADLREMAQTAAEVVQRHIAMLDDITL